MFSRNFNVHFKVVNIWFTFILFLIVISNVRHQEVVTIFNWLNWAFYFLIFIQSIFILNRDPKNRFIFLNISLFALFHCVGLFNIFLGYGGLIENDYLAYFFFEYRIIILSFFFALSIIYIAIKYYFQELKPLALYGLTLAIILPVFWWQYSTYILDMEYILEIKNSVFWQNVLNFNFLPLTFIFLYGFLLYRHDKSLGEYVNTVIVCFFIMTLMDIINLLGIIYDITIFAHTQYVLLINLTLFTATLFRLINYVYSPFGQFYDSIVTNTETLGVLVKRKRSATSATLEVLRAYFHQRRNAVGFFTLLFIFGINYFDVSYFAKINMVALSVGALILLFYLSALYQKRLNNGNILNIRKSVK